MPSWGKPEAPHKTIHKNVHFAIDCMRRYWTHDDDTRDGLINAFHHAESASVDIVETINQILREKRTQARRPA
jgi:hypothetical protein